jgi:glycosyltransferase involved in cell wall biosynthesis
VRASLGISADTPVIGIVGRTDPAKGHAHFLEAFRHLRERIPAIEAILLGRGTDDDTGPIANAVAMTALGRGIHRLGEATDARRVHDVMNALDLLLMPSEREGFPNVVAEAMSCGVVPIVTDVGDAAKLVGDIGMIVPRRAEAFSAAVLSLLGETVEARRARSTAARERILTHYSQEESAARYHRLWTDLLAVQPGEAA